MQCQSQLRGARSNANYKGKKASASRATSISTVMFMSRCESDSTYESQSLCTAIASSSVSRLDAAQSMSAMSLSQLTSLAFRARGEMVAPQSSSFISTESNACSGSSTSSVATPGSALWFTTSSTACASSLHRSR
ncbi:hypothetical protein PF002_g16483 [Phytophthora fragariae]|uniref:Uncharacterized protein n=1 Tax=Phytophthora fragariae TaxID=53985 RepID=A0A6A3YGG8_9STRA|nr:hypothetical protein PF002_g16483 [Phytophthora fragariae]